MKAFTLATLAVAAMAQNTPTADIGKEFDIDAEKKIFDGAIKELNDVWSFAHETLGEFAEITVDATHFVGEWEGDGLGKDGKNPGVLVISNKGRYGSRKSGVHLQWNFKDDEEGTFNNEKTSAYLKGDDDPVMCLDYGDEDFEFFPP